MKTMDQVLPNVLTEVLGLQMKGSPASMQESPIEDLARWLKIKTHNDPQIKSMARACQSFALSFKRGEQPRWISIIGNTGTGKTHCARRLWNHLSARADWRSSGFIQCETYWPKFVSDLRAGESYDRQRDMLNWPVLFLDDIGAERDTTGFASEQLNMMLGCRIDRWTIITSNLMLDQLGKIDPRISDRIIREPNIFVQINTKSHSMR